MNTRKHGNTWLTQGEFVEELHDQRVDFHEGHAEGTEQEDPEASLREASLLL